MLDINYKYVGYALIVVVTFIVVFYFSPLCKMGKKTSKYLPEQERTDPQHDKPEFDMAKEAQKLLDQQKQNLAEMKGDDD